MNTRKSIKQKLIFATIVLAFGLVSLPSAGAAGAGKNVTTNTSYKFDEDVFNPVTGETVSFSGDVRVLAHTKFLADGTVRVSIQCDTVRGGVGLITGAHYVFTIHEKHEFSFNATGFPFTVTIQCDLHLLNAGKCNDVEVPTMVQFTVQKDGSVSAQYVEDDGGDATP